jgi:hypothetical protein
VRVIFSHAGFNDFVNFASTRLDFLKTAYGGEVPSLNNQDPDILARALDQMYGVQEKTEEG